PEVPVGHAHLVRREDDEVGAAGAVDELVGEIGEQHREAEGDEREIEPLDAERGEADQRADDEAQRHRDRQRRDEVPAVVVHEDGAGVRAEAEERAVADRYLAVVAGEDVEPGRRDPDVDRRRPELHVGRLMLLRDPIAEHVHRRDRDDDRDERTRQAGVHTRSVRTVPNKPAGRKSNTSRIKPNGTTSSMPLNASMYCTVSALATPTMRPPTTAPTGLSKPPSAVAANANTRMLCIEPALSAVVVGITS